MTALILVDVIDAFFAPGQPAYYPESARVLGPLRDLLDTARRADRLVVHAAERHRPGLVDFEHKRLPRHCEIGDAQSRFVDGFQPSQQHREIELPKRRYSAFYATDLDLLLREHAIEAVVVAGVKTAVPPGGGRIRSRVCVRATIQDAFAAGYEVLLPREATNSNRPHLAEASLEDIDRYFGHVISLAEAKARL